MITPFRPILAAAVSNNNDLVFPLIGTPKIDGIRCLTLAADRERHNTTCTPVTRSLKFIPNIHVMNVIATQCPPGLDGELIVPNVTFQRTASLIMSHQGMPEFEYHVFDHLNTFRDVNWAKGVLEKYMHRLGRLGMLPLPSFCKVVKTQLINNIEELNDYEEKCLAKGYEGICLRSPHSPYKFGRSSLKEHWLMKLKRFEDSEAIIIGVEELMHNVGPDKESALGYKQRRRLKGEMIPGDKLGAFIVRDLKTKVEFNVGSGLCDVERQELWEKKDTLIGQVITYKHQPHGAKDKPRAPIFKAFRGKVIDPDPAPKQMELGNSGITCSECYSVGFKVSITGKGCAYCDGTVGSNPQK